MKTICNVVGCEREVGTKSARGMCAPHYKKFMKYGDPLTVIRGRPIRERFMDMVGVSDSGCWEWKGRKNTNGYGVLTIGHTQKVLAHRMSWALANGYMPELHCLHKCDNPGCVNPDHIFLGTQADNNHDMWDKGRGVTRAGRRNKQCVL